MSPSPCDPGCTSTQRPNLCCHFFLGTTMKTVFLIFCQQDSQTYLPNARGSGPSSPSPPAAGSTDGKRNAQASFTFSRLSRTPELCLITSQGPDTDNPGLEADRAKSPEDQVSHGTFLGPPAWCKEQSQLPVQARTLSADTNQNWNG